MEKEKTPNQILKDLMLSNADQRVAVKKETEVTEEKNHILFQYRTDLMSWDNEQTLEELGSLRSMKLDCLNMLISFNHATVDNLKTIKTVKQNINKLRKRRIPKTIEEFKRIKLMEEEFIKFLVTSRIRGYNHGTLIATSKMLLKFINEKLEPFSN